MEHLLRWLHAPRARGDELRFTQRSSDGVVACFFCEACFLGFSGFLSQLCLGFLAVLQQTALGLGVNIASHTCSRLTLAVGVVTKATGHSAGATNATGGKEGGQRANQWGSRRATGTDRCACRACVHHHVTIGRGTGLQLRRHSHRPLSPPDKVVTDLRDEVELVHAAPLETLAFFVGKLGLALDLCLERRLCFSHALSVVGGTNTVIVDVSGVTNQEHGVVRDFHNVWIAQVLHRRVLSPSKFGRHHRRGCGGSCSATRCLPCLLQTLLQCQLLRRLVRLGCCPGESQHATSSDQRGSDVNAAGVDGRERCPCRNIDAVGFVCRTWLCVGATRLRIAITNAGIAPGITVMVTQSAESA